MRKRILLSKKRNLRTGISLPLLILLLASLACSVPTFQSRQPSKVSPSPSAPAQTAAVAGAKGPTQAPAVQAVKPTPAPTLPPAVVEVQPLPGSDLPANTAPVFYFNQPMQRASVEAAFKVQPNQAGQFEWLNDSTLRFKPAQPDQAKGLDISIAATAKAANGLALRAPVSVHFAAPGPLQLADRLPAPDAQEVNPTSAVVATFNQPVVALGADPASLPAAFSLNPAAQGRGEWLNTSTYIFYPQPALLGGARYSVQLNPALTSTGGSSLSADTSLDWAFSTAAPVLLSAKPTPDQAVLLDSPFVLTFNQAMDRPSVEANLSLVTAGGTPVAGTFSWNDASTEVTFQPAALLERGANYSLVLDGAAQSLGGAKIGSNFVSSLVTVPQFGITQTNPAAGETLEAYSGYGGLSLTFNSPVALGQDLNRLITISPALTEMSVNRDYTGLQVYISGYFQPSTSYTLTVSADLKDRWGAALGTPFSMTFSSQPASPSLTIPVRMLGTQVLFVPQNEAVLPGTMTNLTGLKLSRGKLALSEFLGAQQDWQGLQNWQPKVQETWNLPLQSAPNVNENVDIPLTPDRTPLNPGLYFLNIDTQPVVNDAFNTPTLLVVSPVQLVLKTSNQEAFVWAVRIADNQPLAGGRITILDGNATPLATCTTDANGVCQVDLPVQKGDKTLFAMLGQPGEANFSLASSSWSQGVGPWEFNVPYEDKGGQPEVYLYTDRPIYRPGQTVDFRAIVRTQDNGRYLGLPLEQVTVDVVSPYDPTSGQNQVLASIPLQLDAYGAAAGAYTLPDDIQTGTFLLRVQEVKYKEIQFQVAEYRKPEIDLQVKFNQPEMLLGQDLTAKVTANYFFGAPAGNLAVHWTLYRQPAYQNLPDGYTTGILNDSWYNSYAYSYNGQVYTWDGMAQTAPDGTLTITIPHQDLLERLGQTQDSLQQLNLEVTATDESGLPVSARDSQRLYPAPYIIGVRAEQWSAQANQELTFSIRTVDWQSNPVADKLLSARFLKVTWKQPPVTDPAMPQDAKPEYTEVSSTDFRTSANGEARLAFTPQEPGTYVLDVTGAENAHTQAFAWVGGPGSAVWPRLPNQRLQLRSDAASYKPGQSAHIFIPNPFEGGALALVTVERAKVMRSSIVQITDASYDLQLPLDEGDAPNVYVSITLLGRTSGRPDFRVGYVPLKVDPAALLLNVDVQTSPQQPQPGSDVTVKIHVKDAQGQPVQGAFSLALVDKAVLALADPNSMPIGEAFYGTQPLGVQSSLSLVNYAGRMVYAPPGRGGGGGGEVAAVPAVRSNFQDTAFWKGSIQTDVNGTATLTVPLPDNLTTWRADVRGLSEDARVGQGSVDLVVSKPLLINPVVPRFVVVADHLALSAMVFNNTADSQKVSARLEGSGFTLDDPNQAVQPFDLAAGERKLVTWWGTAQDVDALDLTFSTEAGALRDAAHPQNGAIPVRRYTALQSFGTAGMLADAGQQMELVSVPRSFKPLGGELQLEISPSLTAVVFEGLKALDAYPHDFTEPILSAMLPNLATAQALQQLNLQNAALGSSLNGAVTDGVSRLVRLQNSDGGWGWAPGYSSDPYVSSYVLFGLSNAAQSGVFVDQTVLQKARDYLAGKLFAPTPNNASWQLDRLAFQYFVLQSTGQTDLDLGPLYQYRDKLAPWSKAWLALALDAQSPGDSRARTLISDLEASASRLATGANWQDPGDAYRNGSSPNITTAIVAYAIARVDPAAAVLTDAVRYLVLNRRPDGGWASSYETAWALMALVETVRGTGDLQASYAYSASLNDSPLIKGHVDGPAQAVNPDQSRVPLSNLNADAPNALTIQRDSGSGQLYYRAYLRVDRPAEDAPAVERGMSITRQYYRTGQDCRNNTCTPLEALDLAGAQPVQVRLTLTVAEDMYYVVVEDYLPAGAEVLNPHLKTSQQNLAPDQNPEGQQTQPPYDLAHPFDQGWGWWLFNNPQVYDDHVRWVVDYLPAGTYELTYRITPFMAGEFHLLPAHAWAYYFPEVEGTSKGAILTIK